MIPARPWRCTRYRACDSLFYSPDDRLHFLCRVLIVDLARWAAAPAATTPAVKLLQYSGNQAGWAVPIFGGGLFFDTLILVGAVPVLPGWAGRLPPACCWLAAIPACHLLPAATVPLPWACVQMNMLLCRCWLGRPAAPAGGLPARIISISVDNSSIVVWWATSYLGQATYGSTFAITMQYDNLSGGGISPSPSPAVYTWAFPFAGFR